ncbi:uncharacterized protein LOC123549685 isoform X2 [Mercenaria mercenaria]|uniref:uncharacterized protein LOC123549685 isoform X2 n=1 Tax=Mercenaria mercenaria TaxID=6596 RepID=UPI00234EE9C7|nr:uncharacterized protein LOC123549685 isoform X2 [Mercenaria mercenaria]
MSVYPTYQHVFSSWEVYPRIHYFQKRFNDLLVRFNRIIGALPESFRENSVEKVLEKIRSDFDSGLQITVIGKEDIDNATLVVSDDRKAQTHDAKESQKHEDAQLSVVVCHIDLESLDEQALRNTTAVIEFAQKVSHPCSILLLKCNTKSIFSEEAFYEFKNAILEQGNLCLRQEDILIRSKASVLQKRISDRLEDKITDGFSKISLFLQRFESDDNIRNEFTGEIRKSDGVVKTIRDFLRNVQRLKDLRDLTKRTEIADKTFTYHVLHHLSHVIRCAAVPAFANKYNQQPWVCNRLLHEIEFEEALVDSVSRNTQYHLSKIENVLNKSKNGRFVFLLYPLQEEMKSTFENAEKKFSGMKRLSLVTKKMLFETNGYIKQTNLGLATVAGKESVPADISDDLRKDLLSVNGVYGLGTIYGKLEVHLDLSLTDDKAESNDIESEKNSNSKPAETDLKNLNLDSESTKASRYDCDLETVCGKLENRLDVSLITDEENKKTIQSDDKEDTSKQIETDMQSTNGEHNKTGGYDDEKNISTTITEKATQKLETIKTEVAEQLKKNRYYRPYTLKCISRKPEVSNGSFEPGDQLLSPTDVDGNYTFGTIGGYVTSTKETLYGLTCLHVVGADGKVYTDNGKELFGNYRKGMENSTAPFIDIAAVEVTPTLQVKCKNYLEQAMTRVTKVKVSHEKKNELLGRYVYKFGAATGVTKGTILCTDYSLFDSKARNYLIVIDPLAAEKTLEDITNVFTPLRRNSSSIANQALAQSSGESQLVEQSQRQTNSKVPSGSNNVVTHSSTASQAIGQSQITASQKCAHTQKCDLSPRITIPLGSAIQTDTRLSNKSNDVAAQPFSRTRLAAVRSPDTDSQFVDSECQSVTKSSDNASQSIIQSSDTASQSIIQSSDTASQSDARSSNNACQSVTKYSDNASQSDARSSDNASQSVTKSSDNASQSVTKSSDNASQSIIQSSDTASQSIIQSSDTASQSDARSSNNACQSVTKSSDNASQSIIQSSDTASQSDARSSHTERVSFTENHSSAECSHIESVKSININEPVATLSSTIILPFKQSSNSAKQAVSKPSGTGIQTVLKRNKGASQTITQTSTLSTNVVKSIQIKSKLASQSPNSASNAFRKLTDRFNQTVAQTRNDANQTDERILKYSGQTATNLLNDTNDRQTHEMKIQGSQNENVNGCTDIIKVDARPSGGQNEIHIERNLENMSLKAVPNVDVAVMTEVLKNVDILDLNHETLEKEADDKVGANETYRNNQNARIRSQEPDFTSDVKESNAEGHSHDDQNTLVYVRDIHSVTESDEIKSRNLKGVFSRNGDSGAIICTPDPSFNGLTCLAVSMLTGGDLEISGDEGLKSLSFTLRKGLEILCKECDIEFETVGSVKEALNI